MQLEQKKNTVEALPRDTVMTTQKDTLSNMQEGKTKQNFNPGLALINLSGSGPRAGLFKAGLR